MKSLSAIQSSFRNFVLENKKISKELIDKKQQNMQETGETAYTRSKISRSSKQKSKQ